MSDNQFAAQLDKVVRDADGYEVYGDPDRFFTLTYPTTGLRELISRTFGRLAEVKGAEGEHGVLRAETSFGGGKTHSLMAVYHLARGARPADIANFVDPSLLPDGPVQVAAVVGDALDPISGLVTNGLTTHTVWGEIGAQLGAKAHAVLQASDEARTAPGTETLRKAFGGRKTVVMIDEIAQHLRQVAESGSEEVRRSAAQIPVFLKNLFEVAMGDRNTVVIVSLAGAGDAYAKETARLGAMLDESLGHADRTRGEATSVLARSGFVIEPATDREIAEILKRRLFADIDAAAAREAGEAYRGLYEAVHGAVPLGGGADSPAAYAEAVTASYPFHPELIRVLDKRLSGIPTFHRARGALRLLAEVVAGIWETDDDAAIVNVADIDLARPAVLNRLTVAVERAPFAGVAQVDIAGPDSHCGQVDQTRFHGRPAYATRVARTVFLHSLELKAGVGAGPAEYVLGTLRPGEDPEILDEALREAERVCWHLTYDGTRWRFHTEPNVNKIVEDGKRDIPNTRTTEETKELVRKAFANDSGILAVPFPASPAEVEDTTRLRVAVFDYDHVSVVGRHAGSPPRQVQEIREHATAAGQLRTFLNSVVFVVADAEAVENLKDQVRARLALEALLAEPARMATFASEVQAKVSRMYDDSLLNTRIAITRCYKHVYFPVRDAGSGNLTHRELPAAQKGDAERSAVRTIRNLLANEGKIRDQPISTDWLHDRAWATPAATTTKKVAEWFWRDPGAQILLDATLLTDAIKKGITHDGWVYYDADAGKAYGAGGPMPAIMISDTAQLLAAAEAASRGLLGRAPTVQDVLAVVTTQMIGPTLRAALEQRCRKEPAKAQVADVLAEAFRQSKLVVTSAIPASGVKALGVKEIRERSLDTFHVLTRSEADRLGVVIGDTRRVTRIDPKTGPAGVALTNFRDDLVDKNRPLAMLRLTVQGDSGRGTGDLDLMTMALAQLPKHQITVAVDVTAELPGLDGWVQVHLNGDKMDYQQVSAKLAPLLKAASEVDGSMVVSVDFGEAGVDVDDPALVQVDTVVRKLAPAEVTLDGTLA
ncbi:DUF499 domain-containing protein [Frankia torreyi]|nr:DUF499 domain-containing protein [Frankia torreyi]